MTNVFQALLVANPEPSLLDAIEASVAADQPVKKLTRVRIIHDDHAHDPRSDMDMMCEITTTERRLSADEITINAITQTKGYGAALGLLYAADPDAEEPYLWDDDVRKTWLEALKDELIVEKFWTSSYAYIAHTTRDMCQKLGVDWANAERVMLGEIETFKQWAEGDVYGFVIEEWTGACACEDCDAGEWVQTDSCWGFYGSDPFENGISEHVPTELHDQLRAAEVEYR